ncbi:PF04463 family protein [Bacteriovorax sp. BSW11_IV]|uniref:DUF523 domain-containing protein n=1 Tax=Bacteriovorax sp. BSW11_IV TaxID=1353529 RepID=UPI00038A3013|nr:DUF523 domain-containing protein [Bacteriovorax sp. BSW11_IV]EQC50288.1 PF04463 family protein [Bacteriovorax sp. BSW11_IV]
MKIVSACLAGVECRFDCQSKERQFIIDLVKEGKAIPVCPEQMGGLTTPRDPSEIQGDKVLSNKGKDVTAQFNKGAQEALKMALLTGADEAYLKSKSPMCGCDEIYDGSFSGAITNGDGIFTKLLKEHGIKVNSVD